MEQNVFPLKVGKSLFNFLFDYKRFDLKFLKSFKNKKC